MARLSVYVRKYGRKQNPRPRWEVTEARPSAPVLASGTADTVDAAQIAGDAALTRLQAGQAAKVIERTRRGARPTIKLHPDAVGERETFKDRARAAVATVPTEHQGVYEFKAHRVDARVPVMPVGKVGKALDGNDRADGVNPPAGHVWDLVAWLPAPAALRETELREEARGDEPVLGGPNTEQFLWTEAADAFATKYGIES